MTSCSNPEHICTSVRVVTAGELLQRLDGTAVVLNSSCLSLGMIGLFDAHDVKELDGNSPLVDEKWILNFVIDSYLQLMAYLLESFCGKSLKGWKRCH